MIIKKIKVSNFKSFKHLDINLDKFNILIGANASGKSNFVYIFKFLKDIATAGLNNAISMQGGVEYLRNMKLGGSSELVIEAEASRNTGLLLKKVKSLLKVIDIYETTYKFVLSFHKRGSGFKIKEEKLKHKYRIIKAEHQKKEDLGGGEILIFRNNGKLKIEMNNPPDTIKKDDIFPPFLKALKLPPNRLFLGMPILLFPQGEIFHEISIYDLDPKLPKKATPISGKAELEEDGNNLSIVLKNIIENKEKRRKLFNLVSELLPFVENIATEKFADKSMLFKLQEKYFKRHYLPSSLISDGTISIIGLIVALFFERKLIAIIEEPERNIHPYLISRVLNILKDASNRKQIIITTHNSEILKHADLKDVLLIFRDEDGFSKVTRPADSKEVKIFLKNKIGLEELYVQNLLGGEK